MFRCSASRHPRVLAGCLVVAVTCVAASAQQQPLPRFSAAPTTGWTHAWQALVNDWVARFVKTTGQGLRPGAVLRRRPQPVDEDDVEAVTHALMTTQLTDASGGPSLTPGARERVEAVRGEVSGTRSDRQFRYFYARLAPDAVNKRWHGRGSSSATRTMPYSTRGIRRTIGARAASPLSDRSPSPSMAAARTSTSTIAGQPFLSHCSTGICPRRIRTCAPAANTTTGTPISGRVSRTGGGEVLRWGQERAAEAAPEPAGPLRCQRHRAPAARTSKPPSTTF